MQKVRRPYFLALCLSSLPMYTLAAEAISQPLEEILITAPRDLGDYDSARTRLGLTGRPLLETPASVAVITRGLIDDQGARNVAGLIGNDASLGENYSPLGYYEVLSIRGFTLDNASGYKRNGLTIANESSMPLENKERIEILKGAAGFEAGMAAPGGVVNYVTKQPTDSPTRRITLEGSGWGTRYAHADVGGRVGGFGYRLNAAREDFHPYVKEAVGHRDFLSAALDWRPNERVVVALDADWQKKSQLSVPGYQLLDGTVLPPDVDPKKMLNNQSWSQPVVFESRNLGGRVAYEGAADWNFEAKVNHNRIATEDNAAFPYGCSSGTAYLYTFCGNGDYDLYDYRSSGEIRTALHTQALLNVRRDWGIARHDASIGLSRFERTVALGREVYDYVGTDNIYNPNPLIFSPSPTTPGDIHRNQYYTELAAFGRDSISIAEHWKIHAGARVSGISDEHFAKSDGAPVSRYRRTFILPQAALVFSPRAELMSYASYSEGLELGGVAGVTTANAGQIMNPKISRQVELGAKRDLSQKLMVAFAAFHIWKPYEFVDPGNVFVQRGAVKHSGLEFSATGRLTDDLRVYASVTMLHALQSGTGIDTYDGHAPVNVPWLRTQTTLDWSIPWVRGASINGSWARVSEKYATRDNTAIVPAYHRFEVGTRYAMLLGPSKITWRFRVENVLNTVHWKDVGEYFGDGYLHLGAPRTFRLSAQVDF